MGPRNVKEHWLHMHLNYIKINVFVFNTPSPQSHQSMPELKHVSFLVPSPQGSRVFLHPQSNFGVFLFSPSSVCSPPRLSLISFSSLPSNCTLLLLNGYTSYPKILRCDWPMWITWPCVTWPGCIVVCHMTSHLTVTVCTWSNWDSLYAGWQHI